MSEFPFPFPFPFLLPFPLPFPFGFFISFVPGFTTSLPGRHDLPVAQLLPPEENHTLRKIDPHIVKSLKVNVKRNLTGTGVPPLVVFCNQVTSTI